MTNTIQKEQTFSIHPVGYVHAFEREGRYEIRILPPYVDALQQLEKFSHVVIIWWADKQDLPEARRKLTTQLPYAPGQQAGVFACRSEYRPNPIAITIMPIIGIDHKKGILTLPWIDAFDCTPVLDLKPYIPLSDRVRDVKVAEWLSDWPEWMEDAGAFFAANEIDFGN